MKPKMNFKILLTKRQLRSLLYTAFLHGKNDMWESTFQNEWLKEVIEERLLTDE
mgnify:CR=1 FL=1